MYHEYRKPMITDYDIRGHTNLHRQSVKKTKTKQQANTELKWLKKQKA